MKTKMLNPAVLQVCCALLAMSSGTASAFQTPLITNGDFANGLNSWYPTGTVTLKPMMLNGVSTQMACMPEQAGATGSPGVNILTMLAPLVTNTRYRMSFDAIRDNSMLSPTDVNFAKPGKIRAVARNNVPYQYREEIHVVSNISNTSGSTKRITMDFVTPEIDVYASTPVISKGVGFLHPSQVFLMSGAEGGPTGGSICVKNVVLSTVGSENQYANIRINQLGFGKNRGALSFTLSTHLGTFDPQTSWVLVKNSDGLPHALNDPTPPVHMILTGPTVGSPGGYQNFIEPPYLDAASGDYVSRISVPFTDIPNLQYDTNYTVYRYYMDGYTSPQTFRISSKSVYGDLKYDALQFFYLQRAGETINDLTRPIYRAHAMRDRPAGNVVENAACFVGKDLHGNDHKGCKLPNAASTINVSGGWYDAADTGKYVVNAGISLWTLQNMIERLQSKRIKDGTGAVTITLGGAEVAGGVNTPGAFMDGTMGYPASPKWPNPVINNKLAIDTVVVNTISLVGSLPVITPTIVPTPISDLMNEARHAMKFLLKMQAPPGTTASVPLGMQDVAWNSTTNFGTRVAGITPAGDISPPVTLAYQTLKFTDDVDVSGMAFHSVHDPAWTPIPTFPGNSPHQNARVLETPTTAATLALAATGAQCFRIWKNVDRGFADTCLAAAKAAWAAVRPKNLTSVTPVQATIFQYGEYSNASNVQGPLPAIINGAGAYADTDVRDEFYWAGMELYLATTSDTTSINGTLSTTAVPLSGDYINVAIANAAKCGAKRFPISCEAWVNSMRWGNVAPLGSLSAITALPAIFTPATVSLTNFAVPGTAAQNASPLANLTIKAAVFRSQIQGSAYRVPMAATTTYDWGSNADIMNAGVMLGIAADVTVDKAVANTYRDDVSNIMNYLLGNNSLGKSFVSGYGINQVFNPHHRVWAKQAAVYMQTVPPGVVVGGPNGQENAGAVGAGRNRLTGDTVLATGTVSLDAGNQAAIDYLSKTLPGCKGYSMRCYEDNVKSFHTNEVAINWNAPFFWIAEFLNEQGM